MNTVEFADRLISWSPEELGAAMMIGVAVGGVVGVIVGNILCEQMERGKDKYIEILHISSGISLIGLSSAIGSIIGGMAGGGFYIISRPW